MVATDRLITFSLSDVGRTRKENQDACGEFSNALGERLLVVADGMGGHAGGVTASRLCIESVAHEFESTQGTPADRVRLGLESSNHSVFAASQADPALTGMGTTGVALLFAPDDTVCLGWVGDSRAYRYRDGQLEQLSDDHSVVGDWVRQGVISAEEAETHPRRNELTRAIGPEARVDVDVRTFPVEPGDIYLLCSDGLCGYMTDPDISAVVGFETPENAVRKLVDTVNVERNSPDNVTVQIIAVPGDDDVGAFGVDSGSAASETYDEELDEMSDVEENGEGYPRTQKVVAIAIALLIVALLLAGAAWYNFKSGEATKVSQSQIEEQQRLDLLADEERARRAAEGEAAAAAEAARLQAQADAAEAARLEAERLAEVARQEEADRAAAIAAEIAAAKAALAREEAATAAAAAQLARDQAAERERILAEQERNRQEAIAAEEARAVEIAFNMAREVDAFVGDWVRALHDGDYALYKQLGFRESEEEFRILYPENKASYEIAVLEKKQWVGGFVALRVNETYELPGAQAQQTTRRLVLRPTSDGMRFAGDRN